LELRSFGSERVRSWKARHTFIAMHPFASILAGAVLWALPPAAPSPTQDARADTTRRAVEAYAVHVHSEYSSSREATEVMRAAIRAFCAAPTEPGLGRAREAWTAAREIYGRTEVFRFGNGPIDSTRGGTETFINAWPVDEEYIEPADPDARRGIIRDSAKYPALGRAILRLHNQRGGETNVCTGWHAIEFMLWGRDLSETGPGARPAGDFVDANSPHAARRREYLLEITDMLCEDLARLEKAWAPDADNHRKRFVADAGRSMRSIVTGPSLLVGFEMTGERLAVPLETRDQEEEHSCFSDTTHIDYRANIRGIDAVLRGRGGPGVIEVVTSVDGERAAKLDAALARALKAVDEMPAPFDRAIRAADGSPERVKLKAALEALEELGEEIARAGRALGWSLPTEPTG
jgi:putative iron-regulated protein